MKKQNDKRYLFEPGDTLRKVASQDFKVSSMFEAKEKINKIIAESVGNTRYQLRLDTSIDIPEISSNDNNMEMVSGSSKFNTFNAIVKVSTQAKGEQGKDYPITVLVTVRDGKLMPIETAEFMGHTFFFSKKFLDKALEAIDKIKANPFMLDTDSSFTGLGGKSTLSDDGRIYDVLSIRNKDSGSNGFMANAPLLSRASEAMDQFLEKSASLTEYRGIEKIVKMEAHKLADEMVSNLFEKTASLADDVAEKILTSASVFENFKKLNWKKLAEIDDKKAVQIVDIAIGGEDLMLKNAVVFKTLYNFQGPEYMRDNEKRDISFSLDKYSGSLIIDEDGNYKLLKNSAEMASRYLVADSNPDFKLKGISLKKFAEKLPSNRSDLHFLVLPDGVIGPVNIFTAGHTEDYPLESKRHLPDYIAKKCIYVRSANPFYRNTNRYDECAFILEKGFTGMKSISDEDREAIISNLIESPEQAQYDFNSAHLISEDILVISVKGYITTPVESLTDIIFGYKSSDKPLSKIASEDFVRVEKPIPDVNKYNVTLSKGMLNKKMFAALREDEVVKLLKSVSIAEPEAISMVAFLKAGEREITRNVPLDFSLIDGSMVEEKATDIVKNFMGKMFGKPQQEELLKEVVSSQIGAMLSESPTSAVNGLRFISSLASDAEALADRFEKLAVDHRSREFQEIAKCMVACARMDQMMVKVASEVTMLDSREAFKALSDIKPLIEKSAAMLYDLKRDQDYGETLVGQNTLSQAFNTLNRLYTYSTNTHVSA